MASEQLPIPKILGWQALYEKGARAKVIKDDPPMVGFGRSLKIGDVVRRAIRVLAREVRNRRGSGTRFLRIGVISRLCFR